MSQCICACAKAPRTAEEKNHTQDVPHAGKDHTWEPGSATICMDSLGIP